MKATARYFAAALTCLTLCASAQMKIFQNGSIAYGSTTAPAYGEKHHFSGNVLFSATPVFPPSGGSSALIRGNDLFSGVTTPDYTWMGNDQTGLFHPAMDVMGLSVAGHEKIRLENGSTTLSGGTIRFDNWSDILIDWNSSGCCAVPAIYPENDWYMQLGTSSKWIGIGYVSHLFCKQNITLVSDENFKQNIDHNVSSTYARLLQLKPATYNFKPSLFKGMPQDKVSQLCSQKQYGLIAQEVMQQFPDLVEKDESTGSYGLNYIGLIPVLIEAVKIQNNRIDSLKHQLGAASAGHAQNASDERKINSSFLKQNSVHSAHAKTTIEYVVSEKNAAASVMLFDMNGKLLKTLKAASAGALSIDANELGAGMYYYSLVVNNNEVDTKKLILTE